MMSLELRINGMLLGVAYIENMGVDTEKGTIYDVRYFRTAKKPHLIEFSIYYEREKGAEGLALLVYESLNKKIKKLESKKH